MKTTISFSGLKQLFKVLFLGIATVSFMASAAWAQKRITEDERKDLQIQVKEGLLEYKQAVEGAPYDFEKMRPDLLKTIHEFYEERIAAPDEIEVFMDAYDEMAKKHKNADDAVKEKAIYALFNDVISKINNKPINYRQEGESCNNWSCAEGLSCAPVPQQKAGPASHRSRCEVVESSCQSDSDCCTGYCHEDYKTKQKSCRPQMKCYQPVALGESCNESPVCEEGSCLPFSKATSTVLACELSGNSCSESSECCSGLCQDGSCQKNFVCKDCVSQGQVAERGRNCCEGLMKDDEDRCVIDRPPFVDVDIQKERGEWSRLIQEIASLVIPSANAQPNGRRGQDTQNDQGSRGGRGGSGVYVPFPGIVVEPQEPQPAGPSDDLKDAKRAIKDSKEGDLSRSGGVIREEKTDTQKRRDRMEVGSMARKANEAEKMGFELRPRSDFEKCDINFKNDFFHGLKEKNVFNYQLSLLGFEYVALGTGVKDLWTVDRPDSRPASIHRTLKDIAKESRDTRRKIFAQVAEREKEVKCLCYDKNGYDNLNEEKQGFYREECPELYGAYKQNKDRAEQLGQADIELGDASGIKYKMMYSKWVEATKRLEEDMLVINNQVERKLRHVGRWMASNNWNETEIRNINLFRFTVKNPSGRVMIGSAITAGLLSAGIIAITGGFAAGATLSAWAAAGIITASATTGGMGGWLLSSLKGAWTSKAPIVQDEFVPGRENYKCGKKTRCADYTRILRQPYNKVCNKHFSANACIKSFLTFEEDEKTRYLIDPWIPLDVEESLVIRDTREYAGLLESGFNKAKRHLAGKKPGGKKSDSYLEKTFVDEISAGYFTPDLREHESKYTVTEQIKREVKQKAQQYAIQEAFFLESEEKNLELFGSYVWDYHYVFPRKTLDDAIAYPPPGLVDYVELVSLAASNATANNIDTERSLAQVHQLVLEDLKQTRDGFGQGVDLDATELDEDSSVANASEDGSRRSARASNFSFDPTSFTPGSSGSLSAGSDDGTIAEGSLEGKSEAVKSAIASNREIREEREEAMRDYKEKMGDSERGKRMLAAQEEVKNNFFSPLSPAGGGSSSGSGGSGLQQRSQSDLAKASDQAQQPEKSDVNFSSGSNNSFNTDFGSSSSRGSARTSSRGSSDSDSTVSDEDTRKMKDVIDARDKVGKEAFEKQEGQSLWEIVTNTYIRVYDKLLPKRESAARLQELE